MTEPGKQDTPQHDTSIGPLPAHQHVGLQPGSIILDRYKVIGLLGAGGMGSVFHVQHLHLQTEFALKVLNRQADKTLWRRFENEARAASRLDHPNLIKVYDSGLLPDGQPFFVMEFVKGQTLADLVAKHGRLPIRKTLKIFIQVGFALAYAHDNGVIHRDLKPSNIMLSQGLDGSLTSAVKVVDLGIAKLTGADEFNQQTLTRTGEVFGSPLYMSPEQCMGTAVDSRADLYSLGCSMYEALTGAPPFIGENALSTMMKHQMETPLSLKEASMGITFPQEIELLVAKLLEKNPHNRHANAQLLTSELVRNEQELGEPEGDATTLHLPASEANDKFEIRKLVKNHYITILLMIICYLLGLATGVLKHTEPVRKTQIPKGDTSFALFPKNEHKTPAAAPVKGRKDGYFSKIAADGKTRLFKLPEESVGVFRVDGKDVEAKGNVSFPVGCFLTFRPAGKYLDSVQLLQHFRRDELASLELFDWVQTSTEIFKILPEFKSLRRLQVSMTVDDSVLAYVDQLPILDNLDVSNTSMTGDGVSRPKRLPHLKELDCSGLDHNQELIKKLPRTQLRVLKLQSCNLKPIDLKQISKVETLEELDLGGNLDIDDQALLGISDLSKLKSLHLAACSITGKSLNLLKRFKNLEVVCLPQSNWSPEQKANLRKHVGYVEFRGDSERKTDAKLN